VPILQLETGAVDRVAHYREGSGFDKLIFEYQVQSGDVTSDLDCNSTTALKLNGGSIWGDDNATLILPDIGTVNSLSHNKDIVVDATLPLLSNTAQSDINQTVATIKSQSNKNGHLHCVITTSPTVPTAQQIFDGQDHTGNKAVEHRNATVNADTLQPFTIMGLVPSTTYYYYFVATDGVGNRSLVADGNFTTLVTPTIDNTPDAFTFTAKTNQALSNQIESNSITLSGMDNNVSISISGGEYQINGGGWSSSSATVDSGDSIKVHTTSSTNYSTKVTATLTVGTVSSAFDVTTKKKPVTNSAPTINNVSDGIAINDTQMINPFGAVELEDSNGHDLFVTLTLDSNNTGTLSNNKIESGAIEEVQKALRAITFTPTENIAPVGDVNQSIITLSVSDGSLTTTHTLEINVTSINNVPEIKTTLNNEKITKGATQSFKISIADRDFDDLNLTATTNRSQIVSVTPNFTNPIVDADYSVNSFPIDIKALSEGNATVTLTLTDGNLTTTQSFKVEVPTVFVESAPENNESNASSEGNSTEPTSDSENNATQENNTSEQKPTNPESNTTVPTPSDDNATEGEEQTPLAEEESDKAVTIEEQSEVIDNALVDLAQRLDGDIKESEKETEVTLMLNEQSVVLKLNKSSGRMKVVIKDKTTKERQKFTINLKKSETLIDDEGNLLIQIPSNKKEWIETRVGSDGRVEHIVHYSEKRTRVTFDLDANTTIDENGTTTIESQFEQDDSVIKAIVVTNKRGKSKTKFIKINLDLGKQEEFNTLRKDHEFDHGSEVELLKKDGKVYIKTKVNIDGDLVIE
jgi:hypothetical protein